MQLDLQLERAVTPRHTVLIALIAGSLALAAPAAAQEWRQFNPIIGPGVTAPLPAGARPVGDFVPVPRQAVESGVRRVLDAWNTPQFEQKLSEAFYDKARLGDALDTLVPRDAKIRVLGVQGTQTLSQYVVADPSGLFDTYVSRVSATVRTQVEFNSPQSGFQRRDGTNEIILRVTQRVLR
jgi:hypothetical protein